MNHDPSKQHFVGRFNRGNCKCAIVARRDGLKAGKNGKKVSTTRFVATTRFLIP